MMADDKPDLSITHDFGRSGSLFVECYGGDRPLYVLGFGAARVTLTGVDLDNYIAELTRIREGLGA